ncbi:MAG TPA: HAD family phosphatase [Kineosporiaceae bacterium]|nr:HAD family phosphatase [Kineosporiaceae bacterium]
MSATTADGVRPGDAADDGAPAGRCTPTDPRPPARLPAAVLWDMDGTLVDTEPYWIDCEFELVAEHGGTWSLDHAHALVGNSLLASAEYIRHHGGVELQPEQIVDRLLDGVVARVRGHVPWRPGAQELLAALAAAQVPCALVTMSYRRLAEAVLAALPPAAFATVVAGDDVTYGKPHPEPYLMAAARLGVLAADCVAIEDSPTGVASAVAAGVPVLAVEHLLPLDPGPGRYPVPTLVGVTPAQLAGLRSVPLG